MTAIAKLPRLQNRAAKTCCKGPLGATTLPLVQVLNWPTVKELIDSEEQKMVFRSLNWDMLTRVNNSTVRSLRNDEINLSQVFDLRLPFINIGRGGEGGGQKCFAYRGAKLWNSLRTEVRSSSTIRFFKNKMQALKSSIFFVVLFIYDRL